MDTTCARDADAVAHPETVNAARLSGCKNFVQMQVRKDACAIRIPAGNVLLHCARSICEGENCIGICAHHIHPACGDEINCLNCRVMHVTEDVFLLLPEGAQEEAP